MYTDKDAVVARLKERDYADNAIYAPREINGITAMERSIGKKLFQEYLSDLIIKPVGKPVLVLESDKRPEINSTASAVNDFADDFLN